MFLLVKGSKMFSQKTRQNRIIFCQQQQQQQQEQQHSPSPAIVPNRHPPKKTRSSEHLHEGVQLAARASEPPWRFTGVTMERGWMLKSSSYYNWYWGERTDF